MKHFAGVVLTAAVCASSAEGATLAVPAGKDAQERLQSALIDAKPAIPS